MSNEIIHVRNGQATLSDEALHVANIFNPLGAGISELHCEIVHGTVGLLAEQIYRNHADASGQLIVLSDSLQVGDTQAAITAWRALESR